MSEDRNRQVVAAVADYLSRHGYRTATGVALRGRSGANYTVDVLAEKSDDVTTFRLMIECKALGSPVDKDVMAPVHMTMTDLGINKAILLSEKGWKQATETAAKRLGIELWGPVEIEGRLGKLDGEEGEPAPPAGVQGFPSNLSREEAEQVVRRQSRGMLGIGTENVVWFRQYWLPFYRMKIRHTHEEKERFRKPTLRTREQWNLYEGLSGSLYDQWDEEPTGGAVKAERLVRPRIPALHVVGDIEDTARHYNESTNPEATLRHEERLLALGVDLPVSFFDLSTPTEVYIPFFLALLRTRDGQQRIVAIDASSKDVSEEMSRIAMMHLDHIVGSTGGQ
jgi:Restriction endonuclease